MTKRRLEGNTVRENSNTKRYTHSSILIISCTLTHAQTRNSKLENGHSPYGPLFLFVSNACTDLTYCTLKIHPLFLPLLHLPTQDYNPFLLFTTCLSSLTYPNTHITYFKATKWLSSLSSHFTTNKCFLHYLRKQLHLNTPLSVLWSPKCRMITEILRSCKHRISLTTS